MQTLSAQFGTIPPEVISRLRLPWSHYVRLLAVKNENARAFYEDAPPRIAGVVTEAMAALSARQHERPALLTS